MHSDDGKLYYGVARIDLHIPGVGNLKDKRSILRRAEANLRREFDCSYAEVAAQDLWQRAVVGVAIAASSATVIDAALDRIREVIERDPRVQVLSIQESVDQLDADTSR